jgi:hypothetical protein
VLGLHVLFMIFDLDPTNRLLSSLVGVVVGWCGFLDENLSSCKDLVMPAFWVGVVGSFCPFTAVGGG